jgi:cytoskeleton protein RodZ
MSENRSGKNEKTIGEILKKARLVKNITIDDVSRHTKIHHNILEAIENDDFQKVGAVYAKGFLKIYSEYLGIDKDDLLRRFEKIQGQKELKPTRKPKVSSGEKKTEGPPNLFFQKVLGWFLSKVERIHARHLVIGLMIILAFLGMRKIAARRRDSGKVKSTAQAVETQERSRKTPKQQGASQAKTAAAGRDSASKPEKKEKVVLVVRAKSKCWMQVKVDGKVVFQNILAQGAAESWQANDKIELWLGNAGGIELELNGKLLEKIGRPGQTLKNVVVTRSGLSVNG